MKRAPIVLTATALGLGATLGFHAHRPETTAITTVATTRSSDSSSSPSASSGSSGSSRSSSSSSSSRSSSSEPSTAIKTVTSDAAATPYGEVQLRVTVSGATITRIDPVQLPSDDPRSQEISSSAAPQLRRSALTRQSADVDVVSGATYTSEGYRTALQSALDRATNRSAAASSGTTS